MFSSSETQTLPFLHYLKGPLLAAHGVNVTRVTTTTPSQGGDELPYKKPHPQLITAYTNTELWHLFGDQSPAPPHLTTPFPGLWVLFHALLLPAKLQ